MFLLLLLLLHGGNSNTVYCDKVIYEHYYNINKPTELVYDELIFYELDYITRKYIVQNYVLLDEKSYDKTKSITYIYRKFGNHHTFTIYRDKKKIIIKTKIFLETITIDKQDLEMKNREIFEEENRRSLW